MKTEVREQESIARDVYMQWYLKFMIKMQDGMMVRSKGSGAAGCELRSVTY